MPAEKGEIIRELGKEELLLPGRINDALVANDRIKYYFALIQGACARADHPDREYPSLQIERESTGIDDGSLDSVVAGAVLSGPGTYRIPCADKIFAALHTLMQEMYLPFRAIDADTATFKQRLAALMDGLSLTPDGAVSAAVIGKITSGDPHAGDSLHLLVMDLHQALNALQHEISQETIAGARTYLLAEEDHTLVGAFMAGVNRTAPLRFDHPGLGTTATRTGRKLVIQNNIGLTDAHVLVITVEGATVTITYTDVHMSRLRFFQSLFADQGVCWADTLSRQGSERLKENLYHLSVGTYTAASRQECMAFLTHTGSRIVFLIDWNRARKRLRNFLRNRDAVAVLKWAADAEVGHMGFLTLGGEQLIYEALELASEFPIRYGEPLHKILGREKTAGFFRWVLKTTADGLLSGTSRLLLADEIKAELLGYLRSTREELLSICEEHATLTIEVATVLRDSLDSMTEDFPRARVEANARRAKRWERRADEQVLRVRSLSRRIEAAGFFFDLIGTADDILDCLEEGCHYSTLVPDYALHPEIAGDLVGMADIAVLQGQEFMKALIAVQYVQQNPGNREDMQQFLEAVDQVVEIEQRCDDALRHTERTIMRESSTFGEMQIAFGLSRTIEESTNAAMKAAYILRDATLGGPGR